MMRSLLLFLGFVALFIATAVFANPPINSSGQYTEWFNAQKVPGTETSCCGEADGHLVDAQLFGDRYVAFIGGTWVPIPDNAILHNSRNPTGSAVAWIVGDRIYCFAPGSAT